MGTLSKLAGGALDWLGTAVNAPEYGWSEKVAGGNTQYTGQDSAARSQTNWMAQNPTQAVPVGNTVQGYANAQTSNSPSTLRWNPDGTLQGSTKTNPPGSGTIVNPTLPTNTTNSELDNLNSLYDYNAEQARNQLSSLGTQYQQGVNEANTGFENIKGQIGKTKKQNLSEIDRQIQSAGSTAQQTQMKNRNILRALGILNSSYAGESLQRPMEQFAQQRNDLMTAAQTRSQELDDLLTQKTAEHQNMLAGLRSNYDNLVNQVNTDLRFNDRQRADAIKAVNSALSQSLYNIQQQQQSIAQQVANQKTQLQQALASVNAYTTPQANLSNITSALEAPGQVGSQSKQQASIYGATYDPTKRLTDLYTA